MPGNVWDHDIAARAAMNEVDVRERQHRGGRYRGYDSDDLEASRRGLRARLAALVRRLLRRR